MTARSAFLVLALLAGCAAPRPRPPDEDRTGIFRRHQEAADRILRAALESDDGYRKLTALCLEVGPRLSGSKGYDRAVEWAMETLRADGQENVRAEKVMVPKWVRGSETLLMREPAQRPLAMLGLGGSVGTPEGGITAAVIAVKDKAEFEALPREEVEGKIVLFNYPMPPYDPVKGAGYGLAYPYRANGADWASSKGGVAALVRSLTAVSLNTPHTGMMHYSGQVPKVPTAAVSIEDAEMIARLTARGTRVTLALHMEAENQGLTEGANVVAELRGRERPEEIVVIGGHLDSWDVGQGAHDDGTGCVAAIETLNLLRRLGLTPRRTIRVVLWANEENGLKGARQYVQDHLEEMENHVAGIESDSGGFQPLGFSVDHRDKSRKRRAAEQLRGMLTLLESIGATEAKAGGSGADVGQLTSHGVATLGLRVDGSAYFNYHHTHADTIDKVDPVEFARCTAAMAVVAYILAEMPGRLGE